MPNNIINFKLTPEEVDTAICALTERATRLAKELEEDYYSNKAADEKHCREMAERLLQWLSKGCSL